MADDRGRGSRLAPAALLAAVILSSSIVALERREVGILPGSRAGGEVPGSEGEIGGPCWGCAIWLPPLGPAPGFRIGPRDAEEDIPFAILLPPIVPDDLTLAEVTVELPRRVRDGIRRALPEGVRGKGDELVNLSDYPGALEILRRSRVDAATVWVIYVPPDWEGCASADRPGSGPSSVSYEDVLSCGGLVIEEEYLANGTLERAREFLETLGENSNLSKVSPVDLLLERDPTISKDDVLNYTVSREGGSRCSGSPSGAGGTPRWPRRPGGTWWRSAGGRPSST